MKMGEVGNEGRWLCGPKWSVHIFNPQLSKYSVVVVIGVFGQNGPVRVAG